MAGARRFDGNSLVFSTSGIDFFGVRRFRRPFEPVEPLMDEIVIFLPYHAFRPSRPSESYHPWDHLGFAPLHVVGKTWIDRKTMWVALRVGSLQAVHLGTELAHDNIAVVGGVVASHVEKERQIAQALRRHAVRVAGAHS